MDVNHIKKLMFRNNITEYRSKFDIRHQERDRMMKNLKAAKKISILLVIAMVIAITAAIGVSALQIYSYDYSGSTTAIGSLYGYRVDDYIRIAFATTYVSGGSGLADAYAYLYVKGTAYPGSASGDLSSGVSAQTGQQVFTSSDNVQSTSSSHSVTLRSGGTLTPSSLSMNVSDIT